MVRRVREDSKKIEAPWGKERIERKLDEFEANQGSKRKVHDVARRGSFLLI
ncbi:hypothetical protein SESBI_49083 [Sesbania bispinosa]|nr:hypothetical protein SESBI_49083 [Sesbania bispinosa]